MQPLAQCAAGHTLAPVSEASARHSGEGDTQGESACSLTRGDGASGFLLRPFLSPVGFELFMGLNPPALSHSGAVAPL